MNVQTREIAYKVLELAQELCPTGKEQQAFANVYNEMIMVGEDDAAVVAQIVQLLHNGLEFNNWPTLK